MSLLALDGSFDTFSAAISHRGVTTVREVPVRHALEEGLRIIDEVLGAAHVGLRELDAIAVGRGPGSFTGIRIAVSYAKGLALAAHLRLIGVSSYDVVCAGSTAPLLAAFVPARRGFANMRLKLPGGAVVTESGPCETLAAALLGRVGAPAASMPIACAGAPEDVLRALGERGFIVRTVPPPPGPAAAVILEIAGGRFPADSPHAIAPDYGELAPAQSAGRG